MYIPRSLIASKGTQDERIVDEAELLTLGCVVVLLGEPGIGKTELTIQLAALSGVLRVNAGTFCRASNVSTFSVGEGSTIIVDGLDEIAASGAEPAIDKVLRRLSALNNPRVIISCRAADWTGASNRAKIQSDYGVSPVPVHILPFNNEQAKAFLSGYHHRIDAVRVLSAIELQGLNDLVGNPLTLRLLAEVWLQDGGLPSTRTELLNRATLLLTTEENEIHDQSAHALASSQTVSEAAGCIFAHLLLSGAVGVATNNRRHVAEGFIPLAAFSHVRMTVDAATVMKTRLFRSDYEDHLVPVHRVVAEYLAARWLGEKLDEKLSERRLFQLLQFNGGVPSALRGLHAWLGHFSPKVRERCIDADPYGFLRYGETRSLSVQSARNLLKALTKLAGDDPYFRSEDWSVRAIEGLARSELKAEIVALITSPQRHVQLSALILESLAGSSLTHEILPELIAIIKDASAPFVERREASEALAKSSLKIDWQGLVGGLLAQDKRGSWRLAVEIIPYVGFTNFSAQTIADALIALNGLNDPESRETRIVGSDYKLVADISVELGRSVLDCIASKIAAEPRPRHWHPGRGMTSVIERLVALAIDGTRIDPTRFWSWVSRIEGRFSYREEQQGKVRDYLLRNVDFRHEVQRQVLYDETIDGGPWMAIVHELQRAIPGLGISTDDAAFFLDEISREPQPSSYQMRLWEDLVRATWRRDRTDEKLQLAIDVSIQNHQRLGAAFHAIIQPPARDYEAEERKRQHRYEVKRQAKFQEHRIKFKQELRQIINGENLNALNSLAYGYLARYSDLRSDADPHERLIEWVGEEIAQAAFQGFVAALQRDDLPSLDKICSARIEGKQWKAESVMLAGISEVVRSGKSLHDISLRVVRAVLGIWWDMPEFHSTKLGEDIEKALEERVFSKEGDAEKFVSAVIKPQLVARKQYVTGLYRFVREPEFLSFSPKVALSWLREFPNASFESQKDLICLLLSGSVKPGLEELVQERIVALDTLEDDCQKLWFGVAFCFFPSVLEMPSSRNFPISKDMIWTIKALVRPDRMERSQLSLSIDRYAAIVEVFAHEWPLVGHPASGWSGDQNPWDASDFISYCINSIGADRTVSGTETLGRLSQNLISSGYSNQIKHVAHEQRRNRRDEEYPIQTFDAVKNILMNAAPLTVSDLKLVMLDHIADVQRYLRDADTSGWEVFWDAESPKIENTCRDRLIDLLRPRLGSGIELFPELPMPDRNRVDIYASILGRGLPIEIKGQWHSEVWAASKTQLDERYCRDWRTEGRGVYLVLWFGNVYGKNLPARPDGSALPSNPSELVGQLFKDLVEGERSRIEIVVLDVSKPPLKASAVKSRARQKVALTRS